MRKSEGSCFPDIVIWKNGRELLKVGSVDNIFLGASVTLISSQNSRGFQRLSLPLHNERQDPPNKRYEG